MISALFTALPLLGLEGEPTGFGALAFVIWWIVMLMGSTYALLWSIYGAKQALHVIMAATWAFMILYSAIWLLGAPGTVPGTGPRGREPAWIPFLATSEQAQDYKAVKGFPGGWDRPGKHYSCGFLCDVEIDSTGEVGGVKPVWLEALAQRAEAQGTLATKSADWDFRTTSAAATDEERALPVATVFFEEDGGHLIAGVTIPATAKHPQQTVFAYRDKGQVFYWAAIILGASILLFAAHIFALAQMEKKKQILQGAPA